MFKKLRDYYDYIENDHNLSFDYNLNKYLITLRDNYKQNKSKKKCSFEIYYNDFRFEKGTLKPELTYANGKQYPDIDLFDDDLKYIVDRAENTNNPKHKAKYNHLLWESHLKNNKYCKEAIINYLTFLKLVISKEKNNIENRTVQSIYENLFVLSQRINYKKKETISFLLSNLNLNNINGYNKFHLMKFICEQGKKNDKNILLKFYSYSNKVIKNDSYPELKKEYLSLLILLSKKTGNDVKPYHSLLAETHLMESEKHKESFIVHDYYIKALKQYQLAGNTKKVEEVTVLIEKEKDNLNFKEVKVEHTSDELQQWYETLDNFTTELVEKHLSKDIYEYLMLSEYIFPKAKVLDEKFSSPLMDLVSTMNFDFNRNVSESSIGGLNPYYIHIKNFSLRHLLLVFSKGTKIGKISFESLKEFLANYTWYGNDFTIVNPDGKKVVFKYLDLILPSLDSYFKQSEIDLKLHKNNPIGYILSIDSLTLKFEGVLRAFSRQIGAQTIEVKENGTQERISFDKLLENEKLTNLIPPDDIALFKFLFSKDKLNLRNNIAHCFYKPNDYSASIVWLLICAFLKLGNYKFKN
ncbi:DUF4209 domain-containing protein [Hanstruepera ponticola]|uniref:DUF4209 domain-containing protein n=1 Tax=Hanstruepera ponticola TaxID=2042995 RepID=UPI000CF12C49|nr:DUF4209 domain-containing protein [Hanstruepera ponticola]